MAMGVNARTAFSLLFPEVLNEFQFDRGVAAGIFSFGFFVSAFVAPFVGRLMDRRGPILVIEIGVAMIVLGLGLASIAREPWQIYVTLGIMVGSGANFLGYSVQSQFIPNWFVRRRGLALGIAFSGVGLGSIILLPWLQIMIARDGWRWACLVFAIITAVLLFPLNLLLRKRPADIGLRADGDAAPVAGSRAAREQHRRSGLGVGHLDAVARDAHRAVLVDRARLFRDPLCLVRRAGAPDQIPDRDRRLADGSRVGARHRQPRRRAGADHLRPRVGPHRARMGVDDRLRRLCDLLCGAARAAGRDDAGAALRHDPRAGLPRLFGHGSPRADRAGNLRGAAFRRDLRHLDGRGDRRRRGRPLGHRALHDLTGNYAAAFWIALALSVVSAVAIFIAAPRKVRLVAGRVKGG